MAGFITKTMSTSVEIACDITKKWLENKSETTEITLLLIQTALFNKFLISGRTIAATVAERHPEFQPVAQMIKDNTTTLVKGDPNGKIMSKELDNIVPFYTSADWNDEPDFVSLLVAYVTWGFKYRKEEFDEKVHEFLHILDQQESLSDGAVINLIMSLWFWDYEGFQNRVMLQLMQNAEKPAGFIAKNIDTLANTAYGITKMSGVEVTRDTVQIELFRQFLGTCRTKVSAEVAEKHPEFLPVAQTIENNTREMINLPGEQFASYLEKELNMMMELYASTDWYNDSDFVSLLLAYACWGFKDRKPEMETAVKQLFSSLDQQETLSGGAKLNLMTAMWFWNYDGFQNRVMEVAEKGIATTVAPDSTGYIQTNMDELVMLAINLAKEEGTDYSQASIEEALLLTWLGKRYGVSQVIAANHPVFTAFVKQIETDDLIITNPGSSSDEILGAVQQEAFIVLEYKQQQEALAQDVDFNALHLAFSCWALKDAKEEYEKDILPLFAVLDNQKELSPASMLNLIAALWFWNYDSFQGRVMQRISDIVSQYQQEQQKEQAKRQEYRRRGVCQYCGGTFKGLLSKKCSVCGCSKDY